jgi:hypothetical protein
MTTNFFVKKIRKWIFVLQQLYSIVTTYLGSKIYTGVLARRLNDWADRKGAVSDFQMSFRKGRTTTDNILILRTIVDKYLDRKREKIYWIFVDLQKAFDTVIRGALWWK